jgi:two-component system, sensor histidine kinase and response regulator
MNRGTLSGANILVVDDTVENLRLLAGMLGAQGYEVRPVTSGRQALQAVERDPPDLILLDINMPEMNGYEVCTRLKQSPALKDVPVIFLTALGDVADKVKAFDVGGIDYITKPFQLEEVQARVRTHVALRRASRELSESYDRLRVLEKLRDDLVHMVVHDMRSPLMVLLGHLQLLRQSSLGSLNADAAADLGSAVEAAKTLTRMSNDLLDVSRIEAQKMPLDKREHDLAQIARTVQGAFGAVSRDRALELSVAGPVLLSCDGELVRRVLENLVGNAIKHTSSGGAIRIAVSVHGAHARAEVEDDGPGIPLEARERIFEKFGTVAAKKDQKYHSVGLGLAFCKLAVEAHGGRIGVEAVEPHGSVFWLEIPV